MLLNFNSNFHFMMNFVSLSRKFCFPLYYLAQQSTMNHCVPDFDIEMDDDEYPIPSSSGLARTKKSSM